MVGKLAQTLRHFGFSETAVNKIASALDMVPTNVFSHTAASGVRKLSVHALPDSVNEHAYADRKRALQGSNGSHGAWPEASWQHAVEPVLFVDFHSKTVKHGGYSIRSVREWHDNQMRRGIQHIKNQRFTKSTNTCEPCRAGSLPPTVLVDDRYYQVVAAPRHAGGSSKPASQPPPSGRLWVPMVESQGHIFLWRYPISASPTRISA
eukprot:jgi/Tetstr1/432152/TSEL_021609.t1